MRTILMKQLFRPYLMSLIPVLLLTKPSFGEPMEPEANDSINLEKINKDELRALPSQDRLVEAKLEALREKINEQEQELSAVENLAGAQELFAEKVFSEKSLLTISINNIAPKDQYRIDNTEIYIDGQARPVARGGKLNAGLPRNSDQIYFASIAAGCHEIKVNAQVTRLKNDVLSRFFGAKRTEKLSKTLTIVVGEGALFDIGIELFESQNNFIKIYKNPDIRFRKNLGPNFLGNEPLVSLNSVLNQGLVEIRYVNDDKAEYRLVNKTISIDGAPIFTDAVHDWETDKELIFNKPIAEGEHLLRGVLVFAKPQWVEGGPKYKFRLSFEAKFQVLSGQTSLINLIAMPDGGNRANPRDARFARVEASIKSEDLEKAFPNKSCEEIRKEEFLKEQKSQKPLTEPKSEGLNEPQLEPKPLEENLETREKAFESEVESEQEIKEVPMEEDSIKQGE